MTGEEVVAAVIDAIAATAIPHMLVGSLSSNQYGIPRSTKDADFVLDLGERSIHELTRQLPDSILLNPQMQIETVTMTRKYELIVRDSAFTVELFLLSTDAHDGERFQRRRDSIVLDRRVSIPTAEDVIVTKLRWASSANRRKDEEDVRDVIAVQSVEGQLDWDYIHSWCDQHGTRALLDRIRASIPPL